MKRVIALVLALLIVLALAACGGGTTTDSSNTPASTQNTDTPKTETPKNEAPKEEEKSVLPIEIKEFSYTLSGDYLYYAVHLYNPNESYILEFPKFRISARDADGVLLGSEEQTLMQIYPQRDAWYGSMAFSVDEAPDKVEIEVLPTEDYNVKNVSTAEHTEFKPLEVINTAIRDESRIVGEVKNNNDYEIKSAVVSIIFRDESGKLLGGDVTFVDNVPAGGTAPFDKGLYIKFITDNYEVYADNWS